MGVEECWSVSVNVSSGSKEAEKEIVGGRLAAASTNLGGVEGAMLRAIGGVFERYLCHGCGCGK